jgi:magnesium chelatase subunit D
MMHRDVFPFSAIIGQERLKHALVLNAVNPRIGGVLIRGEKGTAKSTAVRALGELLPEIAVVQGCSYNCDPDEPRSLCENCRNGAKEFQVQLRRIPVVTLPLNATEDRVAGGIDFNLAVKTGVRGFHPGLLAKAHRGILYVDEVNLLDDHIVDIILDAAASGRNLVEREGVSFSHLSRFILVGTMNPEEGELRPQLLDRFGLCVEVASEKDMEKRTVLMHRREEYDTDPWGFIRRFQAEDENLTRRIISARSLLMQGMRFPDHLRRLIGEICTGNNVAGHRADLVIEQAARAAAALKGHPEVTVDDILDVAPLALAHRKRETAPPPPAPKHERNPEKPPENPQAELQDEHGQTAQDQPHSEESVHTDDQSPSEGPENAEDNDEDTSQAGGSDSADQFFDVGDTFRVKRFASPRDRVFRRGSGRRSRTRVAEKQGRYVRSTINRNTGDVAFDATLRAAAPYQLTRRKESGLALVLRPEDIREKLRERRIGNFLLFVVDASGSMGARGRMKASKGAIMSLLLDAYQKRDHVAMVSFRKHDAMLNLPPTASIELAARLLKEMPVGGRTPLSSGLVKSYEVLRNYLVRDPTARPIVIFITDGKSNVALGEIKPLEESLELASRLAGDKRIRFIVVDTESQGLVNFGLARNLAVSMNARYFKLEDLKADTLLNLVKENVK